MPAFLSTLPVWVFVLVGLVLAYIGYKYWQYKKATAYAPKIANLDPSNFTSPRDNPPEAK